MRGTTKPTLDVKFSATSDTVLKHPAASRRFGTTDDAIQKQPTRVEKFDTTHDTVKTWLPAGEKYAISGKTVFYCQAVCLSNHLSLFLPGFQVFG